MAYANLFEVLGITNPSDYTRHGVETAWFELKIAAQNSESAVHQTQQLAYQYLTSDDPGARTLLEYLLNAPDESTDPDNLVLHRTLIILAASARSFSVPNAEIGSLLVEHAGATGLEVYRHDSDPYLYTLAFPEGTRPGSDFVPAYQAGAPLKDGQPRWGLSDRNAGKSYGPQSFADHLVEFAVDLFLFRWLRTDRLLTKFAKILLLVTVIGLVWYGVELFSERSDVWAERRVGKDMVLTSDNAEEFLRMARKRFREVELQGEKEFGFNQWWDESPPSDYALALLRDSQQKKEAFKKIRSGAADVEKRIEALTASVDDTARRAKKTKTRDGVYHSFRTADGVESLLHDLNVLSNELDAYSTL